MQKVYLILNIENVVPLSGKLEVAKVTNEGFSESRLVVLTPVNMHEVQRAGSADLASPTW